MKKYYLIICIIFLSGSSYSNPVESIFVNELARYDSSWAIEIMAVGIESLDGFVLISNTDTSKITMGLTPNEFYLFVITPNELESEFYFDFASDELKITDSLSITMHQFLLGGLIPRVGQSICLGYNGFYSFYYLDNSPTIGLPNDTLDACGNLTGYIADKNGNVLEGVKLMSFYTWTDSTYATSQPDGFFNLRDIARRISLRAIYNNYEEDFWSYLWDFQIFPDSTNHIDTLRLSIIVGVDENKFPKQFFLDQNYPNPFNPTTKIKFTLPNVGDENFRPLQTQLIVYDILGREIKTLLNKPMRPGEYEVEFDATGLPSGVYFYRLSSGSFSQTRKMVLLR